MMNGAAINTRWRGLARQVAACALVLLVGCTLLLSGALHAQVTIGPPSAMQSTKPQSCTGTSTDCTCKPIPELNRSQGKAGVLAALEKHRKVMGMDKHDQVLPKFFEVKTANAKLVGTIAWVNPSPKPGRLICPGGTISIGIYVLGPSADCPYPKPQTVHFEQVTIASSGAEGFNVPLHLRSNQTQIVWGTPDHPCVTVKAQIAQARVPEPTVVLRHVGAETTFLQNEGAWKLCDVGAAAALAAAGWAIPGCIAPEAGRQIVWQWPAAGDWTERPGEILVMTSRACTAAANCVDDDPAKKAPDDSSLPDAPALVLATALGYLVARRFPGNDSKPALPSPSAANPPSSGIRIRGHVDRP